MAYLYHNLPLQPTSFIGRNNEVTAIVKLLADSHCRLLTLVGPGGIGKTRLGIEVAAQFIKREKADSPINLFPDGVYLVALQSVALANNIVPTIAGALGFEFYETRHQTAQLIKYIGKKQLLLLLDNVLDPQNLGAIIRTALSVGIDGIIIPKDRSAMPTPAVSKTSAGAIEHVCLIRVTNMVDTIKVLKQQGVWVVGLDKGADKTVYSSDLTGSVAIVIGGEEKGIRPLVKKNCDFLVSIPQIGQVNSLNASVAAAIAMYEAFRQRGIESSGS